MIEKLESKTPVAAATTCYAVVAPDGNPVSVGRAVLDAWHKAELATGYSAINLRYQGFSMWEYLATPVSEYLPALKSSYPHNETSPHAGEKGKDHE